MLEFDDPALQNLLVELDEHGQAKGTENCADRLSHLLASFRHRREDRQRLAETQKLRQTHLEEDEQQKILRQIIEQQRSRQGISAPTDG
jgi:hypothetical protein